MKRAAAPPAAVPQIPPLRFRVARAAAGFTARRSCFVAPAGSTFYFHFSPSLRIRKSYLSMVMLSPYFAPVNRIFYIRIYAQIELHAFAKISPNGII